MKATINLIKLALKPLLLGTCFTILLGFSLVDKKPVKQEYTYTKELATLLLERIIQDEKLLYQNERLRIYLSGFFDETCLFYVYNDSLTEREKTDRFYLHVYDTRRDSLSDFINNDQNAIPTELALNGVSLSVFKLRLRKDLIDREHIEYFKTGRFISGQGKLLELPQINIPKQNWAKPKLDEFSIIINKKEYEKIKVYREEALAVGIIPSSSKDYVPALILHDGEKIEAKIKLKGDWLDHIKDSLKWSFRIKLDKGKQITGCNKFSLQHPKTRSYETERLFMQVAGDEGILVPQYNFINLNFLIVSNGDTVKNPIGIMAFEEFISNSIPNRNGLSYGPIMGYDESELWEKRIQRREIGDYNNDVKVATRIKTYNSEKKHQTSVLKAEKLLVDIRENFYPISSAFNVDKLSSFVILANLFGAPHGLIWHNLRFYYNSKTEKLSPLAFDMQGGAHIKEFRHFPYVNEPISESNNEEQYLYYKTIVQKLPYFLSDQYWATFIKTYHDKHNKYMQVLKEEFHINSDLEAINANRNFLIQKLYEDTLTSSYYKSENNELLLTIKNKSYFPIEIIDIITDIELNKNLALNPSDSITVNLAYTNSPIVITSSILGTTNNIRKEVIQNTSIIE